MKCGINAMRRIDMEENIQDAIANIASTSKALDKLCDDPETGEITRQILENVSWELHRQASDLQFLYGGYYG